MPRISAEWGRSISDLMGKHGLSTRGAMLKAGGRPSHTTIKDWMDGILPTSGELAIAFLEHFPRDEGIECLRAGGFLIPPDWLAETERCANPLEAELRRCGRWSEEAVQQILQFAEERMAKVNKPGEQ